MALPPEGSAKIKGGDTLLIANGNYKMGFGAPAETSSCSQYYPWDCNMQKIPSGPSTDKPTKILGAGYASGNEPFSNISQLQMGQSTNKFGGFSNETN